MKKRTNPYEVAQTVRYCLPNGTGFLEGTLFETEIDALVCAVAHRSGPIGMRNARTLLLEAARAGLCILTVDLE